MKKSRKYPKVLVTAPTHESKNYCVYEYLDRVSNLTYPNYDVYFSENSPTPANAKWLNKTFGVKVGWKDFSEQTIFEKLVYCHNDCFQKGMDGNFDYVLHLETDVIPPLDIIERLMFHRKRVTNGWYFIGGGGTRHPVFRTIHHNSTDFQKKMMPYVTQYTTNYTHLFKDNLMKVYISGLGCMLIHKSVFKKAKFRLEKSEDWNQIKNGAPDSYFCNDLYKVHKVDNFVDLSAFCQHINYTSWGEGAHLIKNSKTE